MLNRDTCGLVLVDVQGKLANNVHQSEQLIANLKCLLKSCQALSIPVIWLEQYPKGLGKTHPELVSILNDYTEASAVLEKTHFNALAEPDIQHAVKLTGRKQWLIAGIESHICVYQTALGLLSEQYSVYLICDGVASLNNTDKQVAIQSLDRQGVVLSSVEMAIFELLRDASSNAFKPILSFIKEKQQCFN